jgi:hypothetical protein
MTKHMTWITDERQGQQTELARTIANYVCANKETLRYQMVAMWDRILDAIDSDVLQLNAVGNQLIVEHGPTMIQVRRENEIAPLFMLEVDLPKGRLRSCPLPPGKFGIPRVVEFQMRVGVSDTNIMVQEYPNGTVVRFVPEQVSHGLLDSALSLNVTRSMKCA